MTVFEEDIRIVAESHQIDWEEFNNCSVLITGSTGLIGKILVEAFLYRNKHLNSNVKLILPVRDIKKAKETFSCLNDKMTIFSADITQISALDIKADYVIHSACPTQSSFFVEKPVETIDAIVLGTKAVLEYVKNNNCKGAVYLSSMETFGQTTEPVLSEEDIGKLSLTSVRSVYPESKRLAELLCHAYYKEYDLPIKIARLSQVFGPGVSPADNKVFMQFCNAIKTGDNIILKTKGDGVVNFCYTTDAVLGILKVLQQGNYGEAYSIVNSDENFSLRNIADWLLSTFGNKTQKVCIDVSGASKYAVTNYSKISNDKVLKIGWKPKYSVKQGYERLLKSMDII